MLATFGKRDNVIHFQRKIIALTIGASLIVGCQDRLPFGLRDVTYIGYSPPSGLPIPVGKAALRRRVFDLSYRLVIGPLPGAYRLCVRRMI